MPHPAFANPPWHDVKLEWLKPLVELVKGTSVKLYPDLYPRRQPPAASLYSADELYDLGCDGITLWDTFSRVFRISEWAIIFAPGTQGTGEGMAAGRQRQRLLQGHQLHIGWRHRQRPSLRPRGWMSQLNCGSHSRVAAISSSPILRTSEGVKCEQRGSSISASIASVRSPASPACSVVS